MIDYGVETDKEIKVTDQNNNTDDIDKQCPICYGRLKIRGADGKAVLCTHPVHNKNPLNILLNTKLPLEEAQKYLIPEIYADTIFIQEKIQITSGNNIDVKSLDKYKEILTQIYMEIASGKKPNRSYLIFAPQGYGKTHWVYACMTAALKAGLSVVPYFDTHELYMIENKLFDAQNNYDRFNNEVYYKFGLEHFYTADVCFIKLRACGALDTKNIRSALSVMYGLLDCRARKGLPTIVVSRHSFNALYNADRYVKNTITDRMLNHAYSKLYYVSVYGEEINREDTIFDF